METETCRTEGKIKISLLLSVSMKNQWNKVFLTVSGELQCHELVFFYVTNKIAVFFCTIHLRPVINLLSYCVCNLRYSFFSPLGGSVCPMKSWSWCFSGRMLGSHRNREQRAKEKFREAAEARSEMWVVVKWGPKQQQSRYNSAGLLRVTTVRNSCEKNMLSKRLSIS